MARKTHIINYSISTKKQQQKGGSFLQYARKIHQGMSSYVLEDTDSVLSRHCQRLKPLDSTHNSTSGLHIQESYACLSLSVFHLKPWHLVASFCNAMQTKGGPFQRDFS